MFRFLLLVAVASPTWADDSQMSPHEAIHFWAAVKWAHFNCPPETVGPFAYMMAAAIEERATAEILDEAESTTGPALIERFGTVEASCKELASGLSAQR